MSAGTLKPPIIVGTNEDLTEQFRFTNANLDGFTASFGLRKKGKRGPADLMADGPDHGVTVDGDTVSVLIPAELVDDLAAGDYDFELKLTSPTGVRVVKVRGLVKLVEGIA